MSQLGYVDHLVHLSSQWRTISSYDKYYDFNKLCTINIYFRLSKKNFSRLLKNSNTQTLNPEHALALGSKLLGAYLSTYVLCLGS